MAEFTITVTGTAHEIYVVDAESAEAAAEMFNAGELTDPVSSEVDGCEIEYIKESD